jgi:ketosteroid isomerase-like protein
MNNDSLPAAIVRAMFQAIDARNWSHLGNVFAEDCRYERPGFPVCDGLTAILYFYENVRPIHTGVHTIENITSEGSCTYASGAFSGFLKTGSPINLQFADMYLFRQKHIRSRRTFFFTPLS